jgi:nucleoside-diphosphate-sugar epimerase
MADILITGGAGNFGRMLGQALRDQGHTLRLLDLPTCDYGFCQDWDRTRVFTGDILDPQSLAKALEGAEWVFHLAAILPPASEIDRDRTFRINVDGTRLLLEACLASGGHPKVVLASSISVYGEAGGTTEPIGPEYPVRPIDIYAESKVAAENLLMASGLPWINLRIAAIAIPEFLDPPEPWPFMAQQRVELVALADLVLAMTALVQAPNVLNRTLIISGGPTWQVTGRDYVRQWAEAMEIPFEEMIFLDRPGWLNWYDTGESQSLLNYQATTLGDFFGQLRQAVAEALA